MLRSRPAWERLQEETTMKPIERVEVLPMGEYELVRPHFRARVIEAKRPRRVKVSEHLTAIFENRDSVMLQIQEMLRTERISNESGIRHEIETYNELIPGDRQLSMTLFVEVEDRAERERILVLLAGLEDHIGLEIDGQWFGAKGRRPEALPDRTTAVHYLKIDLADSAVAKLKTKGGAPAVVVKHPKYTARAELSAETLAALAEDFA
jgi:hypothetical protein